MILDGNLQFDPAGTAITVTAVSTNVLDLLNNRDLGVGQQRAEILTLVGAQFTSATAGATLTVQVQAASDNGSGSPGPYNTIWQSPAMPLGQLAPGEAIKCPLPIISQNVQSAVVLSGTEAGSTTVTMASTAGISQGMYVSGPGIVPGTTVASFVANTSVTLSQAATASQTVNLTFQGVEPPYRFLRLNYVASATMTAGTVQSYLALGDGDAQQYYRPGVVVNN